MTDGGYRHSDRHSHDGPDGAEPIGDEDSGDGADGLSAVDTAVAVASAKGGVEPDDLAGSVRRATPETYVFETVKP